MVKELCVARLCDPHLSTAKSIKGFRSVKAWVVPLNIQSSTLPFKSLDGIFHVWYPNP